MSEFTSALASGDITADPSSPFSPQGQQAVLDSLLDDSNIVAVGSAANGLMPIGQDEVGQDEAIAEQDDGQQEPAEQPAEPIEVRAAQLQGDLENYESLPEARQAELADSLTTLSYERTIARLDEAGEQGQQWANESTKLVSGWLDLPQLQDADPRAVTAVATFAADLLGATLQQTGVPVDMEGWRAIIDPAFATQLCRDIEELTGGKFTGDPVDEIAALASRLYAGATGIQSGTNAFFSGNDEDGGGSAPPSAQVGVPHGLDEASWHELQKINPQLATRVPRSRPQQSKAARIAAPARSASRFRTNSDLFNDASEAEWQQRHGLL
jgi:hypothetical protein